MRVAVSEICTHALTRVEDDCLEVVVLLMRASRLLLQAQRTRNVQTCPAADVVVSIDTTTSNNSTDTNTTATNNTTTTNNYNDNNNTNTTNNYNDNNNNNIC